MRRLFMESEYRTRVDIATIENLSDAIDGAFRAVLKTEAQADLLGEALQLLITEKQKALWALRDGYDECARSLGHVATDWHEVDDATANASPALDLLPKGTRI